MFWKKTIPEVKSTLEVLQERSGNAVKLITDTIDELKNTNEAIDKEKAAISERIAALKAEDNTLSDLSKKNTKIVSNFEALLK